MKYLTPDMLVSHPKNVRANTTYATGSIDGLAASIAALGLLQSLVVQQLDDGTYGVLAGRRRMLAIQQLATTGGVEPAFKVPCKVIAKDVDHVTALSLAENTMQEPMNPLDEYEAFASMIEEGETIDGIATTFGTVTRTVKERLRYGKVHEGIRAAVRSETITLDVMKAYAIHPCQETQKRVFDGFMLEPTTHSTWAVRGTLAKQDIRADDPLAVLVMDRYRERGGEMIVALFDEDTVLKNRDLAETIRDEILMEKAEEVRAAHGFKWCETRAQFDFAEIGTYGRIRTAPFDLDEKAETRLGEIAERLDVIAGLLEEGQHAEIDHDALNTEYETLEEEADTLQTGYLPEQAAHAGVVVSLYRDNSFHIVAGLVRAEDYSALNPPEEEAPADSGAEGDADDAETIVSTPPRPAVSAPSMNATVVGSIGGTTPKADPLSAEAMSAALRGDLGVERAYILQSALAGDADLARDVLIYRLASDMLPAMRAYDMNNIRATKGSRTHSRSEVVDASILRQIEDQQEALDLSWSDASLAPGEQFRAFRALDDTAKTTIMAFCVAATVDPHLADNRPGRTSFMEAVAADAIEDIRTVWKPTADNYWSRVTRDHMLALLKSFGMAQEAEAQRTVKKGTLAKYMEALFANPFATLSEAQRVAVESWTPPGFGTRGDNVMAEVSVDDPEGDEDGDPACSNLEEGQYVIGQNPHGETLIEDANGVRSADSGGVYVTEPVPIVPGAGIIAPNHSERKLRYLTVEEADDRKEAA